MESVENVAYQLGLVLSRSVYHKCFGRAQSQLVHLIMIQTSCINYYHYFKVPVLFIKAQLVTFITRIILISL